MSDYPEHGKLSAVKDKSQAIGEFVEWLGEQGIALCAPHEHGGGCLCDADWHDGRGRSPRFCPLCDSTDRGVRHRICGTSESRFLPRHEPIESLLARYFEIDLAKIEAEKRAMLDKIRGAQ